MELTVKARGIELTDQMRASAERKLSRLARIEPRAIRAEVEVIAEHNPRLDGTKRVEVALRIPRRTFRAHAEGRDVEAALDGVADRLERQLRDHHGRWRRRAAADRLQSATGGGEEQA